jgi:hypothetical protein
MHKNDFWYYDCCILLSTYDIYNASDGASIRCGVRLPLNFWQVRNESLFISKA